MSTKAMDHFQTFKTNRASAFSAEVPPRAWLLQQMVGLPLVETLTGPGWHVLCDAPMQTALRAAGLSDARMSDVLENGAFLQDKALALPAGDRTLVIATRRSELAVAGVMRARGLRAMPLFGTLLPRLAAFAPARLGPDALRSAGPCARVEVLPAHLADAMVADKLDGAVRVVAPFGRAQVALAQAQADIGFDVRLWWQMIVRAQPGVDRVVLRVSDEGLAAFVAAVSPEEAGFVQAALATLPIAAVAGDARRASDVAEAARVKDAARVGSPLLRPVTVGWPE